jgi:low temperature requirement protein LtrA
MTTGGGANPLRREHPRPTFLELFFDLAYIFALTRISHRMAEKLVVDGGAGLSRLFFESGRTAVLLLALWGVWWGTAWTTNWYDPRRAPIQLVVFLAIFGSLTMGVAIPTAFGPQALTFAIAFVVTQVGRAVILMFGPRDESQPFKVRVLIFLSIVAVPWIAGALVTGWARGTLWALALAMGYAGAVLGWPIPGLGRFRPELSVIEAEHLGERYQQFFLIALGESILFAGLDFSDGDRGWQVDRAAGFAVSIATTILIWKIYFYRAGQILSEAIVRSRSPGRTGFSTGYSHFGMVTGVVVTAVGYHFVIEHPFSHSQAAWIIVILGGPALYMIGRARFEYEVFGRVSRSRVVTLLVLAALFPAMIPAPMLVVGFAAAAVLAGAAIADARRARGAPPEPPAPPY